GEAFAHHLRSILQVAVHSRSNRVVVLSHAGATASAHCPVDRARAAEGQVVLPMVRVVDRHVPVDAVAVSVTANGTQIREDEVGDLDVVAILIDPADRIDAHAVLRLLDLDLRGGVTRVPAELAILALAITQVEE